MTSRGRLLLAATCLIAGAATGFAGTGTASATSLVPGVDHPAQLVEIGGSGGNPLLPLGVDGMVPGSTVVQRFRLHLAGDVISGRPATLIDNVRDRERDCIRPEVRAGDSTCGPGDHEGELSSQLLAGVTWHAAGADGCDDSGPLVPVEALSTIAGTPLVADAPVTGAAPDTCITVTLSLPVNADNRTQSDAVNFDLRLGLVDAAHADDLTQAGLARSALGGTMTPLTTRDSVFDSQVHDPVLPFTGLPLLPLVLVALGLLQLAVLIFGAARRLERAAP